MIYEAQYLGDGGGGWCEVEKEDYEVKKLHPKYWRVRALQPKLSVWYGSMPESNGKTNWTAILHREGECISEGICIDRSEYPERTLYEADKMRYLIGEIDVEPWILDYDSDKHSGYVRKDS